MKSINYFKLLLVNMIQKGVLYERVMKSFLQQVAIPLLQNVNQKNRDYFKNLRCRRTGHVENFFFGIFSFQYIFHWISRLMRIRLWYWPNNADLKKEKRIIMRKKFDKASRNSGKFYLSRNQGVVHKWHFWNLLASLNYQFYVVLVVAK